MKSLLVVAVLGVASAASAAVTVHGAKIDVQNQYILVDVSYGGCQMPSFELKVKGCAESMPAQCFAQVIQTSGDDGCERLNRSTAMFSLEDQGLKDPYYAGASLKISGSANLSSPVKSSATVRIP